jgi:hypothetical protein
LAVRFAVVFLAAVVDRVLLVADFFAVPDVLFFAAPEDEVLAVLFFAGVDVDFDVVFFAALDVPVFFAGEDDVDFFEVEADLPVVFLAADLVALAADLAVVAFFAGADADEVVLVDVVLEAAVFDAALVVAFGTFLAPDTKAFNSAPARNFGTAVFFARVLSPVRGFRTMRAGRIAFSKAPNPVMATFSPRATSAVIVLTTVSRARRASALFPSNR